MKDWFRNPGFAGKAGGGGEGEVGGCHCGFGLLRVRLRLAPKLPEKLVANPSGFRLECREQAFYAKVERFLLDQAVKCTKALLS